MKNDAIQFLPGHHLNKSMFLNECMINQDSGEYLLHCITYSGAWKLIKMMIPSFRNWMISHELISVTVKYWNHLACCSGIIFIHLSKICFKKNAMHPVYMACTQYYWKFNISLNLFPLNFRQWIGTQLPWILLGRL